MFTPFLNTNQGGAAGTINSVDLLMRLREVLRLVNKHKSIQFCTLCLDFSTAYDVIQHEYLYAVLERNIRCFINIIKIY